MRNESNENVMDLLKQLKQGLQNEQFNPEQGLMALKSLIAKRKDLKSVDNKSSLKYLSSQWVETCTVAAKAINGNVVVFCDDDMLYSNLTEVFKPHEISILRIIRGESFRQVSKEVLEMDSEKESDFQNLFEWLEKANFNIFYGIIFLWPLEASNKSNSAIDVKIMSGIYPLYYLVKSIMVNRIQGKIRVLCPYADTGLTGASMEALAGFAKSVGWETPNILLRIINFKDASSSRWICEKLTEEMMSEKHAVEVKYQNDNRYLKKLKEVDLDSTKLEQIPFKKKGVYIITGGTGGLGWIFSEHLSREYQARLVWSGRSELNRDQLNKIDSIKALGAEVVYVKGDISVKENADKLIKIAKEHFGEINGIIHSAGVTRDSVISRKTVQEFENVLASKVYGTVNLDIAAQNENMDFFVNFSSLASITGNYGQIDYAYANGFLNAFTDLREQMRKDGVRKGKTISIHWPLWREGGMNISQETLKLMEDNFRVKPMGTSNGIQAFNTILCMEALHNVSVLEGDVTSLIERQNTEVLIDITNMNTEISRVVETELINSIKRDIGKLVVQILKIKDSAVDFGTEMSGFGFDSITFTEFSNRLNNMYGTNILPSIFFEHRTLESLCTYLAINYKNQMFKYYADTLGRKGKSRSTQITKESQENESKKLRFMKEKRTEVLDNYTFNRSSEPVAIIGVSGIMPNSGDLDEFWTNLVFETDLISEIPKDRWSWNEYYGDPTKERNKTNVKWGGFMKHVDQFDAPFFGISPREAELMDPNQRIFMEVVWKTIEDAGYKASELSGTNTGLYVGVAGTGYSELISKSDVDIQAYSSTGNALSIVPNRISYFLNIHGPSIPVDTACSSSLVTVHMAVEAIRSGECEMAIAGGVNTLLIPEIYMSFNKAGMLSVDGRCKTFDKRANGYVRGEGAGAVFLKPLSKALRDGDHIYALIKGSAVNHGGRANSLTSPNPNIQAEVIYKAWEKSGVDPTTISYIETHGTGTSLGDPVEINGLKKAFDKLYQKNSSGTKTAVNTHCGLGAVKTNIGHLETAAGIAGLLKVVLSLKHGIIPGNLNMIELNPYIQLEDSPFYMIQNTAKWTPLKDMNGNALPRRAGVSSFGFGGANAHIAVEEYVEEKGIADDDSMEPNILVFSARSEESLKRYLEVFLRYMKDNVSVLRNALESKEDCLKTFPQAVSRMVRKIVQHLETRNLSDEEVFSSIKAEKTLVDQLIKQLQEKFQINIPKESMEGINSFSQLVNYLSQNHEAKLLDWYENVYVGIKTNRYGRVLFNNVAYTLQHGREEMAERLAVVSSDFVDLYEKLKKYLQGEREVDDLYCGNVLISKEKLGLVLDEVEGAEYIQKLVQNGKIEKIAKLWVMGTKIEWRGLRKGLKVRRIPLPTYQFEQKRYWYDSYKKHQTIQEDYKPTEKAASVEILPENDAIQDDALDLPEVMNYEGDEVTLEIVDREIAVVKMQDRQNKNMFTKNLTYGLIKRFWEISQNSNIKAVILTGYDDVFCMGGTMEELMMLANREFEFTKIPFMVDGLIKCNIPVISAIQGNAVGGGLVFGLSADLIVMSQDGVYSANFMNYGFTPGLGATYILKEKLGQNISMEMMYTAKVFTGEDFKSRGVSFCFKKKDEVYSEALRIARMLSQKPVYALKVLKQDLSGRIMEELPKIIRKEVAMHEKTFGMPEVKERIEQIFSTMQKTSQEDKNRVNQNNKVSAPEKQPLAKTLQNSSSEVAVKHINAVNNSKIVLKDKRSIQLGFTEPIVQDNNYRQATGQQEIEQRIKQILSEILHTGMESLKSGESFQDLGVDSISGVEIIREINRTFQLKLDAVILYDYPSIQKVSEYIAGQLPISGSMTEETGIVTNLPEENKESKQVKIALKSKDSVIYEEEVQASKKIEKAVSALSDEQKGDYIVTKVKTVMSRILHQDAATINNDENFKDMGIDSISGVEIIREINKEFGLSLEAMVLYDYPNLASLSLFLKDKAEISHKPDNQEINTYVEETIAKPSTFKNPEEDVKEIKGLETQTLETSYTPHISVKVESKKKDYSVNDRDIAVIGFSGRFPGASDIHQYWDNLIQGRDCVTEVPPTHWNVDEYYHPDIRTPNKTYCRWGGFIKDADKFESLFFNISPKEAEYMDPQQRVFLEAAYNAIEDAGYAPEALNGKKCGVFVGVMPSDYPQVLQTSKNLIEPQSITGSEISFLSARISYLLNLTGPNMVIDTACSSSLVAIHQGCLSLLSGDSDMVLAGGVSILPTPYTHIVTSKGGMLSKEGRCKAFDNSADGFVPSEGVGVVVLKPLKKAIEDNDNIYGVIKGSAVNQDGKTNGITAPSRVSQIRLETDVYERFGIDPEKISYIETHGTGTKLGDPIEVSALISSFQKFTDKTSFCALGSVKSNIGHSLAAAGVASLIKVLLMMKYKKLVPTIHFNQLNEHINLDNSPFYLSTQVTHWNADSSPRIAAISSFGLSGTNCHMVVSEAPELEQNVVSKGEDTEYCLIPLSAKRKDALTSRIRDLLNWLEQAKEEYLLQELASTLQIGRDHFKERAAFVVATKQGLINLLKEALGKNHLNTVFCENLDGKGTDMVDQKSQISKREHLTVLAATYTNGSDIDFENVFGKIHRKVSLPGYHFAGESYWIEKPYIKENMSSVDSPIHTPEVLQANGDLSTIDTVRKIIAEALKINVQMVDENLPISQLEEYGADSIILMQILSRVNEVFGFDLPFSHLMNISKISELALTLDEVKNQTGKLDVGTSIDLSNVNRVDDERFISNYDFAFKNTVIAKENYATTFIDNPKIEIIKVGNGTPLLLLPPIESSFAAWKFQLEEFSRHYQVISLNYPGYGRSPWRENGMNLYEIGEEIMGVIPGLTDGKAFHLVGWSMGGLISQSIASRHKDKLLSLTLVNTTSKLDGILTIDSLQNYLNLLNEDLDSNIPKTMANEKDKYLEMIKGTYRREISTWYIQQAFDFDFREKVSSIELPTLILAGGKDKITTVENMRYLHSKIKDSEYFELKSAGHYIPLYNQKYFNQKVLEFVRNLK